LSRLCYVQSKHLECTGQGPFHRRYKLEFPAEIHYVYVHVNEGREMTMNEIVTKIADAVGIEPAVAEKCIGMMLSFLQKEGAEGPVGQMIAAIPGSSELIANASGGGGGLLGGLMGSMGGGVMGLGQQLMSQGLGMGEITGLAKQTLAVAREHAGNDVVDEVIASVPGLSQFV
jgi:hypothetical protein